MGSKQTSNPRERGAVLLLMLGLIFACTAMVAAFVQNSLSEIRRVGQSAQAIKLRPYAYSALEVVMASIHEYQLLGESIQQPESDWIHAIEVNDIDFPSDMEVTVEIEDIGQYIGLSTLTNSTDWEAILEDLDYSSFVSEPLIDAILDWVDSDDNRRPFGAEMEDYQNEGRTVLPPNGPIYGIEEFEDILGFEEIWWESPGQPSALAQRFRALLTPLHGNPPNINTAALPVLSYLTGDEFMAQNILDYRNGPDGIAGTEDDELFENQTELERQGFRLERSANYDAALLTIEITILSGGARFQLSCLLSLDPSANDSEAVASQGELSTLSISEYSRFSTTGKL